MIKLKKLLAGVIGAAMMLTSATALATTTEATTTEATIDTSLKGSLTIHKYEYNGTEGSEGTGEEGNTVPNGAKALVGAGFTIYKVADVDDLTAYYSANPTELPDVSKYVEDGAIKLEYADTKARNEEITGAEGVVEFTNLDLGFYVVIETTTPDAVTTPMTPFIVSIPMTTVDGADWLYDVHVYPKNSTTYGEVKLEKSGEGEAKLEGVTFVLQKKNADGSWTNITNEGGAAGDNTGDALNLTTNASGIISVSGLTQGTYRFIETSVGDNNKGYIMDGKTAYEFTVNANGTVTYGEDGTQAASVTIPVQNEKPDLTKQVKDRTDGTWGQDSDYNVGDTIEYKVTVKVPKNITDLEYFVVTDTPTHLVDDVDSVELMCDGAEVATNAYTVEKNGDGFKITFTPENMAAYADKEIVITYNAVLQEGAATTVEGNPNTAKLEYSNAIYPDKATDPDNPNVPENPEETPGKDVIEDNAIVYTFKLNIYKTGVDGDTTTALSGVVFDLYKEVTADTAGAITGDDAEAVGLDSTKSWLKIDTLTTGADGTIAYSGLANGTYYLVETETNAGYNLLKAPVEVVLNIDYVTSMKDTWEWTNDNGVDTIVKHEIETSKTTFTDNKAETVITGNFNGTLTQNIINKKGFELPTTGGMGSIIFIVGGIALAMAGLMIILASNKRARA